MLPYRLAERLTSSDHQRQWNFHEFVHGGQVCAHDAHTQIAAHVYHCLDAPICIIESFN